LGSLAPKQADDYRPHIDIVASRQDRFPGYALEQQLREVALPAGARPFPATLLLDWLDCL